MNDSHNCTRANGSLTERRAASGPPADLSSLRQFGDHIPQLVWSCLPDGRCDYLSRRWVEFTGAKEGEHHGLGWQAALHPDDRPRATDLWGRFMRGEAEYDLEYRLRRHDGAYRWFKTRGLVIRDGAGAVERIFGTCTDIDDQKRTEAQLRESRERLEAALAASGTGTFRWDLVTNALEWDEQLDRLFGLPPGETVRSLEKFVERVHPDDRPGVLERCRRCKEEGADFVMEFRVIWPDGSTKWLDDRGRTFRDAAGRPAYMTGACVDVTERNRAEEQIREADDRAAFVRRASGVGFWYCDLPFDVLEWDDQVKAHFWLPPDARVTIGTFYDRIHPDDREPTRCAIERSIAGRTGYDVDYRTVHPETGAVRWVRAIGRTFYDSDGAPRRFDGVTLDVTEKRASVDALRASEERFRAFMDNSPTASWVTDSDGRVRYVSATYRRTFRVPERELVGAVPADLYAEEFAREYVANIRAVAESGRTINTVERAPRVDGSVGEFLVYKFPIPGAEGLVGGVSVDITERRRAEEALKESQRFIERVANTTPAILFVYDIDERRNVYANRDIGEVLGYAPGESGGAGRAFLERVMHPDDLAGESRRGYGALADGTVVTVEYRMRDAGGAWRWRRSHLTVFARRDDGTPRQLLGVSQDITEQKAAEEHLREADRRKDEYLAMLAHELRNPLAPVRNAVQILQLAGPQEPHLVRARAMIERQVAHMARLLDDLLEVSRISRGKIQIRPEPTELTAIVRRAVEATMSAVTAHKHDLSLTVPGRHLPVTADPTRLEQVFVNLITNAVKYTPAGGRITVAVGGDESRATVTVSDNGIGISAELLGRVFDLFVQAEQGSDRSQGGLGIGLTLVKLLVDMHGGTVTAASDGAGRGASFTVALPLAPDAPQANGPAPRAPVATASAALRVLVVDDNRDGAESMAEFLGLMGHQTRVAHDGPAALAAAGAFDPDAVLLDIGLPGMDGYAVARALRARPGGARAVLIAATGYGQDDDVRRAKEAGFDHHLVKPVDPPAVLALLRTPR